MSISFLKVDLIEACERNLPVFLSVYSVSLKETRGLLIAYYLR